MNNVLVTGATGLLGRHLAPKLKEHGHGIITHARTVDADFSANLADYNKTFELLTRIQPTVIINLVGLTSVEHCQEQPNEAYLANTRVVENLVIWILCTGTDCHLVQISTDHLYDETGPHAEDIVTLTNNYAFSKYSGELAAARVSNTILRTNFIGRSKVSKRESHTDWLYTSLANGKYIQVLDDVSFSPLSLTTLAEMIHLVLGQRLVGTFNLGSRNGMTKSEFDFAFADSLGLPTETMSRINSNQATFLKAYRPKDMRMDCTKFEKAFHLALPYLRDEIKLAAEDYLE